MLQCATFVKPPRLTVSTKYSYVLNTGAHLQTVDSGCVGVACGADNHSAGDNTGEHFLQAAPEGEHIRLHKSCPASATHCLPNSGATT